MRQVRESGSNLDVSHITTERWRKLVLEQRCQQETHWSQLLENREPFLVNVTDRASQTLHDAMVMAPSFSGSAQ